MALRDLGEKMIKALKDLKNNLMVDKESINILLKEISKALIEADIHVDLVAKLIKTLKKQFSKADFQKYVNKQSVIRHIIWGELCTLLDPGVEAFKPKKGGKNIMMFVGLQGSGKTTTIAKFAYYYKQRKWKCALVCADTFRAGAFDQLKQNATKIGVAFYGSYTETDPVKLATDGVKQFQDEDYELILVDTSGRHKQEKSLFREMKQIVDAIKPNDIVFVLDGTIGQAAMDQAKAFKKTVNIGSCIITKLDGNAKGGGALTAVAATKSPITFIGNGEHFTEFDKFHPQGFSSRLLGYGDPQALMDKMSTMEIDEKKQKKIFKRMVEGTFTMRDLREQLTKLLEFGLMANMMDLISPKFRINNGEKSEVVFRKYLTIMDSMANKELDHPNFGVFLKEKSNSRINRLALGSGTKVEEVKKLFSEYKNFKKIFGALGKRLNWKDMDKFKDDPQQGMKMLNNILPGGAKNARKRQQMHQQLSKMGRLPGMKIKFKK